MAGYEAKSCNALQKPYYRPIEVAIRWCGLIEYESEILRELEKSGLHIPVAGQFPRWPCLRVNTEKIFDGLAHGEIPCGRDGRTVAPDDHVAPPRRTVRHTDLRIWMAKHYPDQKPDFLFDEIERSAHAAQSTPTLSALCRPMYWQRGQILPVRSKDGRKLPKKEIRYLVSGILCRQWLKDYPLRQEKYLNDRKDQICTLLVHYSK